MKELFILLSLLIPLTVSDISVCKDEDKRLRDCHLNALMVNKCNKQSDLKMLQSKSLYKLRKACEECPCCLSSSTECVELNYEDSGKHICPGYLKYFKDYTSMRPVNIDEAPPPDITRLTTTEMAVPVASTTTTTQLPFTCPPCNCPVCPESPTTGTANFYTQAPASGKDVAVDTGDRHQQTPAPGKDVAVDTEDLHPQRPTTGKDVGVDTKDLQPQAPAPGIGVEKEDHHQLTHGGKSHVKVVHTHKVVVRVKHKGTNTHKENVETQTPLDSGSWISGGQSSWFGSSYGSDHDYGYPDDQEQYAPPDLPDDSYSDMQQEAYYPPPDGFQEHMPDNFPNYPNDNISPLAE